MRATRHRLRFVPGVSQTAATYGGSTYGGPITYGQRASDTLAAYRYRVVPLPAGSPTTPAWIFRYHDEGTLMRAQILYEQGALDLTPVASAAAWLAPIDERRLPPYTLAMSVVAPAANGIVSHAWSAADDVIPGSYRVAIVLSMTSGRRLTLPVDDQLRLTVVEVPGA